MRLTFLGTRGNIQGRSRHHRMHSAVIVDGGGGRVLIDCGEDWLGRAGHLCPVAILVSHAHDDHAAGLKRGAPCVPDVADIPDPAAALRGVDVYVGDGATLDRPLIRRRGAVRIGHAAIGTQLQWCAAAGVERAVFTHCGSGIVRSDPREVALRVTTVGRQHGVRARIACDGLRMTVTARSAGT